MEGTGKVLKILLPDKNWHRARFMKQKIEKMTKIITLANVGNAGEAEQGELC